MSDHDRYISPLSEHYANREIQYILSPNMKLCTWRRLWITLAETEKELGLSITDGQIEELKAHSEEINYDVAKAREKEVYHDIMSHVYTYGIQYPKAKETIHLGTTSCHVGDNTDIIIVTEALKLVRRKPINALAELSGSTETYKSLPTLAFIHFQPAQPTMIGERATLQMTEPRLDLDDLDYLIGSMRLLGSKRTTGTQVNFLELFDGDHEECHHLDTGIVEKMGFEGYYPAPSQTYSRKVGSRAINVLIGIAQGVRRLSNSTRLLQHLREMEEPSEKKQIGSSAMAYKRNPIYDERIAPLANYVTNDMMNPMLVAPTWRFERTLDDSANKRLSMPEGFLAAGGTLDLYLGIVDDLVVYPKIIEKHLIAELPFMTTGDIIVDAIKAGGDRQELYERIRELSMETGENTKERGPDSSPLELVAADLAFNLFLDEPRRTVDPPHHVGRSPKQVEKFLGEVTKPLLGENAGELGATTKINVQAI